MKFRSLFLLTWTCHVLPNTLNPVWAHCLNVYCTLWLNFCIFTSPSWGPSYCLVWAFLYPSFPFLIIPTLLKPQSSGTISSAWHKLFPRSFNSGFLTIKISPKLAVSRRRSFIIVKFKLDSCLDLFSSMFLLYFISIIWNYPSIFLILFISYPFTLKYKHQESRDLVQSCLTAEATDPFTLSDNSRHSINIFQMNGWMHVVEQADFAFSRVLF